MEGNEAKQEKKWVVDLAALKRISEEIRDVERRQLLEERAYGDAAAGKTPA